MAGSSSVLEGGGPHYQPESLPSDKEDCENILIEEDSPWQGLTISPWEKKGSRKFIAGWMVM
jgi:hypothetical protein